MNEADFREREGDGSELFRNVLEKLREVLNLKFTNRPNYRTILEDVTAVELEGAMSGVLDLVEQEVLKLRLGSDEDLESTAEILFKKGILANRDHADKPVHKERIRQIQAKAERTLIIYFEKRNK